jgi:hypothetical protein
MVREHHSNRHAVRASPADTSLQAGQSDAASRYILGVVTDAGCAVIAVSPSLIRVRSASQWNCLLASTRRTSTCSHSSSVQSRVSVRETSPRRSLSGVGGRQDRCRSRRHGWSPSTSYTRSCGSRRVTRRSPSGRWTAQLTSVSWDSSATSSATPATTEDWTKRCRRTPARTPHCHGGDTRATRIPQRPARSTGRLLQLAPAHLAVSITWRR